ncbi:hypothetical protein M407DRAFT_4667 [Tulasnella calospora MUT 4182]|uniref:Uncharacterized protein n=1 Tax=Tulasnella calospora MUT 4182 TaxID=1051891 RepID=A0A0C3ME79_9AGAM|nr:hypothetical protein M407DRAFT_4667 [Tulasnella calospora MUT 4182]
MVWSVVAAVKEVPAPTVSMRDALRGQFWGPPQSSSGGLERCCRSNGEVFAPIAPMPDALRGPFWRPPGKGLREVIPLGIPVQPPYSEDSMVEKRVKCLSGRLQVGEERGRYSTGGPRPPRAHAGCSTGPIRENSGKGLREVPPPLVACGITAALLEVGGLVQCPPPPSPKRWALYTYRMLYTVTRSK